MRVLLDTCVISELRKEAPNSGVTAAIDEIPSDNLFLSVITLGEVVKGISLLVESKRKRDLQSWLLELERFYEDRVLEIDSEAARIWGESTANAQKKGRIVSAPDGLIAATAQRHGLHLMTKNVSDFEDTGAILINPWS